MSPPISRLITRRDFVQRSALAAAALSVGGLGRDRFPGARGGSQRVVVVGAGLAGLAAATVLVAQGHDVTVLEAQMRPGGRVTTLRAPFADDQYVEAGPMFIADVHDLTMQYVRNLGLSLVPIHARDLATFFYLRGQRISLSADTTVQWPVALTDSERRLGVFGLSSRYIFPATRQVGQAIERGWGVGDAIPSEIAAYDGISFAEFLRQQGASAGAIALLRLGYLDQVGDGIDAASALGLLRDQALSSQAGHWYAIKGGNDQLPRGLAARLGAKVQYGVTVVRVEQDTTGVRVWADRSGRREKIAADRVVLAIPFPLVRDIEVSPPLSDGKRRAIAELAHTSVTRVFLQFRTRPWGTSGPLAWGGTDLPIMTVREPTYNQAGERGILEAYVSGASGRRLAAMSAEDRIGFVRAQMEKVFPETRGLDVVGTAKCWDADPWARGAYAWFKPGEMGTLGPHIPVAEGRIHFAGDQTSDRPGWMQGALSSGHRVAREIEQHA